MFRSAMAWMRAHDVGTAGPRRRGGRSGAESQVALHGGPVADRRHGGDVAVLGFEDREEPGLLGQTCHPDGVAGRRAPAQGARHQDVEVAGAALLHRPLHLGLEVVEVGDRRGRDVRDVVGHREAGQVLALAEDVARLRPDRLGRRRPGRRWRGAGTLDPGVHVRLVVVADEEHVVVPLEHPRQAAEADVDRSAVTGLADHPHVARFPSPSAPRRPRWPRPERSRTGSGARGCATTSPDRGW